MIQDKYIISFNLYLIFIPSHAWRLWQPLVLRGFEQQRKVVRSVKRKKTSDGGKTVRGLHQVGRFQGLDRSDHELRKRIDTRSFKKEKRTLDG